MKQIIDIDEFVRSLLSLDRVTAGIIMKRTCETSSPAEGVDSLVLPALEQIGKGWEEGTIALSQVYMSGRICEELVDIILPPADSNRKNQPRMAIAVLEDYHFLGKRIVYSMLRASGYELLDYGRVTTDELEKRIQFDGLDLILISVLMMPSALRVRQVRDMLDQAGSRTKIIVGGAPFLFDSDLWKQVGAQAMGKNASEAVRIIKGMEG